MPIQNKINISGNIRSDISKKMSLILTPNKSQIIAVSGGVDSMVLLDICRSEMDPQLLHIVHVDHKVRDDSSDSSAIVREYCREYSLKYSEKKLSWCDSDTPTEASMRDMRYEILRKIRSSSKSEYILTAHHRDDQIETAIFRMLRGSSLYGVTSFQEISEDIYRPLLSLSKLQISDYALSQSLLWYEDYTNTDNTYSRNAIRNIVIPTLRDIHPAAEKNLSELISDLSQWQASHDEYLTQWQSDHPYPWSQSDWLALSNIWKSELLQTIARDHGCQLSRAQILEGIRILSLDRGGLRFFISESIYLYLHSRHIHLRKGGKGIRNSGNNKLKKVYAIGKKKV